MWFWDFDLTISIQKWKGWYKNGDQPLKNIFFSKIIFVSSKTLFLLTFKPIVRWFWKLTHVKPSPSKTTYKHASTIKSDRSTSFRYYHVWGYWDRKSDFYSLKWPKLLISAYIWKRLPWKGLNMYISMFLLLRHNYRTIIFIFQTFLTPNPLFISLNLLQILSFSLKGQILCSISEKLYKIMFLQFSGGVFT